MTLKAAPVLVMRMYSGPWVGAYPRWCVPKVVHAQGAVYLDGPVCIWVAPCMAPLPRRDSPMLYPSATVPVPRDGALSRVLSGSAGFSGRMSSVSSLSPVGEPPQSQACVLPSMQASEDLLSPFGAVHAPNPTGTGS